ncbi:MAG: CxxxxCH/CxxCH domain-containing protein [Bacteroidota bacterium]|nr:CxxxxCH/CxxCH domain-containing protein [Bacteroidota bacterium]
MKNTTLLYSLIISLVVLIMGCSEVSDNNSKQEFHGAGFVDPASKNFHGELIKTRNYDIQGCKSCHGFDYNGGIAEKSCTSCHNKQGGPENCMTCHGSVNPAPPKDLSGNTSPTARGVGAHQAHLISGTLGAVVACTTCHVVPSKMTDAGHIDTTPHAEVRFDSTSIFYKANAVYNNTTGTCANTYCHGNFKNGNAQTMTWTDTTATAVQCGTCHGDVTKTILAEKAFPKSGHPTISAIVSTECVKCHSAVIDANMAIINPAKHINGRID